MTIYIPGDPVGKERPRHTKNGHTYTPAKTKAIAEADTIIPADPEKEEA